MWAAERVESVLLVCGDLIICKVKGTARVYGVSRVQRPKQEMTEQTAPYGFRVGMSVESTRGRSGEVIRSGARQGGESRCSRSDQEKKSAENDDSMRMTSAEELFSLVREEDISVRCSTGCYRLAVLLHYKSYTAPVLPV